MQTVSMIADVELARDDVGGDEAAPRHRGDAVPRAPLGQPPGECSRIAMELLPGDREVVGRFLAHTTVSGMPSVGDGREVARRTRPCQDARDGRADCTGGHLAHKLPPTRRRERAMELDEERPKPQPGLPRPLVGLSVDELRAYMAALRLRDRPRRGGAGQARATFAAPPRRSSSGRRPERPRAEPERSMTSFCADCGGTIERLQPEGDDRLRDVCAACGNIHYLNPKVVVGCGLHARGAAAPLPAGDRAAHRLLDHPRRLHGGGRDGRGGGDARGLGGGAGTHRHRRPDRRLQREADRPGPAPLPGEPARRAVRAGPESQEVRLVAWDAIPWDELAFPTVHWVLRRAIELRGREDPLITVGNPMPAAARQARPGND